MAEGGWGIPGACKYVRGDMKGGARGRKGDSKQNNFVEIRIAE